MWFVADVGMYVCVRVCPIFNVSRYEIRYTSEEIIAL